MAVAQIGPECDVAVIGAGPAGMACASLCARSGLSTVLLDEQPAPGGQSIARSRNRRGGSVRFAGDAAGIAGAQAAAWRGVISAIAVIRALRPEKKMPVEKLARTALAQFSRGRKFLDALYRPGDSFLAAAGAETPFR